jgi:phenylpyruvate tautomerase PptA (4-oxalocrotonate tautomerase family)
MIKLTTPVGVCDDTSIAELQKSLAATLLKWDGVPDTAFFRAQAWSQIDEVADGRFAALEDGSPRFRVDVTVPEGALSTRRKEGLIKQVTSQILTTAGLSEADGLRVWVLIHEQDEGTWGASGAVVRFQDLAALARSERAQP